MTPNNGSEDPAGMRVDGGRLTLGWTPQSPTTYTSTTNVPSTTAAFCLLPTSPFAVLITTFLTYFMQYISLTYSNAKLSRNFKNIISAKTLTFVLYSCKKNGHTTLIFFACLSY